MKVVRIPDSAIPSSIPIRISVNHTESPQSYSDLVRIPKSADISDITTTTTTTTTTRPHPNPLEPNGQYWPEVFFQGTGVRYDLSNSVEVFNSGISVTVSGLAVFNPYIHYDSMGGTPIKYDSNALLLEAAYKFEIYNQVSRDEIANALTLTTTSPPDYSIQNNPFMPGWRPN